MPARKIERQYRTIRVIFLPRATEGEERVRTYPNHGTERISDDEEGEPKEGFNGRDMELGFDTLEASGVDCGTDVDRCCEEANLECDEELFGGGPVSWVLGVVYIPIDEEVVGAFFSIECNGCFLTLVRLGVLAINRK